MWPEDSIQYFVDPWWEQDKDRTYNRGRLIYAFIPHVDQTPITLHPIGRSSPTIHNEADIELRPLRINETRSVRTLPVAALTLYDKEVFTVYRAKKRPCVILSTKAEEISKEYRLGKPRWQTAPTLTVAPYYGCEQNGNRAGFNQKFIENTRRCHYPNFFWDKLPIPGETDSILRLDHLQPVGFHHHSIELTDYCLTPDALLVLDDWLTWSKIGKLPSNSILLDIRDTLMSL